MVVLAEIAHEENLDNLRTAWLKASDLQESLNTLIAALEKAMSYFNIQMVAGWLSANLGMYRFNKLFDGLEVENASRQLNLVADFGYYRGREVVQSLCARAFERVKDASAPENLKALFIFTPGQLRLLAQARMGHGLPDLDKMTGDQEGMKKNAEQGTWRETDGGLIVPR